MEIALRTAGALAAIAAVRSSVPDAVVGVGTVIEPGQLSEALDAGAVFAVSPGRATCCCRPRPLIGPSRSSRA